VLTGGETVSRFFVMDFAPGLARAWRSIRTAIVLLELARALRERAASVREARCSSATRGMDKGAEIPRSMPIVLGILFAVPGRAAPRGAAPGFSRAIQTLRIESVAPGCRALDHFKMHGVSPSREGAVNARPAEAAEWPFAYSGTAFGWR
jgi:hypothetical protein